MTTEALEFQELLQQARLGDQAAMQKLVQQYEREVRMVARIRLGKPLRPYLDSVDLVQSVHRSLMMGLRNDRFDISSPEKLVRLAMTIVRRKVAKQWRKLQRQSRLSNVIEAGQLPDAMATLANPDADQQTHAELKDQLTTLLSDLTKKKSKLYCCDLRDTVLPTLPE